MRSKFFMLAAVAMLAASMPAQAVLTLEFWSGQQVFTTTTASPPIPSSITGLRSWNFASPQAPNPVLNLDSTVTTQYIIKAVLRDHDNSVGADGSGYTISNDPFGDPNAGTAATNSRGLIGYAARFTSTNPALQGTPDGPTVDGAAPTVTVWGGGATAGATREMDQYAMNNLPTPGSFTFGYGVLGVDPINNATSAGGNAAFNLPNGDVLYPLANILLTVSGAGTGQLTLSKPTTPAPTFGSTWTPNGITTFVTDLDIAVWGALGTNVYSVPFTVVPEPSSMILAGMAVTGLGVRLRRKFRRETTTA